MSLPNSAAAATLQQQLQWQAVAATGSGGGETSGSEISESLLNNAFDLMGGSTAAAQHFLNQMDYYAQQQQQQQQLQLQQQYQKMNSHSHGHGHGHGHGHNYHQNQSSPHGSVNSLSTPTSSSPSNSVSSGTMQFNNNNNNNYNNNHHHQQQQQQQQQQQRQQQQHSISLSSSPIPSPISTTPTTMSTLFNNMNSSQQHFNHINNNNNTHHHHHHQMEQQQNQSTTSATNVNGGIVQTTTTASASTAATPLANSSSATVAPSAAVTSSSSPTSAATNGSSSTNTNTTTTAAPSSLSLSSSSGATAATSNQLHQHQHQHQHQHPSSYKSCWCFGESICSGIEVEIENNNNSTHLDHGESTYHMKILVPAVASGAIIGKGGETIASLQKDSGARVKMSKSHDFYPGTTERVCLITGSVEGIMTVLDFIMDKIREKPDLTTKVIDGESKQTQERDKQVKILVPNSTAGMIIGKGGAYIKQIKEESGSYVQISQKPKDISLQERCITIIGEKENNKNACKMILSKIVEDPQSGTCLNVSYADVNGPVANFNPTGSPYATNQNAINSSTASLNSTLGSAIGGAATAAGLLVNGTGINLSLNLGAPNPSPNLAVATQLLEHIKVAMRNSGYTETATAEVCAALGVLAKYGVLGMGVGVPHAANGAHTTLGSYLGVSALESQTAAANAATAGSVFGAVGQVNLEQYTAAAAAAAAAAANRPTQSQLEAAAAAQFDPFRHLGSTAGAGQGNTPVSLSNNSFGLTATGTATTAQSLGAASAHSLGGLSKSPTPGDLSAKDSKNVEIPEVIVGAILGPNGRSLVEIQHVSGANVQISKKGIFAPGTRNRIVTITGQPSAIAKAQFLIEQKINEEETKRARQIPLTTVVN